MGKYGESTKLLGEIALSIIAIPASYFLSFILNLGSLDSEYIHYYTIVSLSIIWTLFTLGVRISVIIAIMSIIACIELIYVPFDFYLLVPYPVVCLTRILPQFTQGNIFRNACIAIIMIVLSIFLFSEFPIKHWCDSNCQSQATAITKEAMGILSSAFQDFKKSHQMTKRISVRDILPYLLHVSIDTKTQYGMINYNKPKVIDSFRTSLRTLQKKRLVNQNYRGEKLQRCSNTLTCIVLHSGGILQYDTHQTLDSTQPGSAIFFNLDPDGKGMYGRVSIYLYQDGHIRTGQTKNQNTTINSTALTSQNTDPSYASF